MSNGKFHIVVSTKGGVGKSTLAKECIAPMVFEKNKTKVDLYEVDDNNIGSSLTSTVLNRKSFPVGKGVQETQKALFKVFDNKDIVIDVGGGNDTNVMIDSITSLGIDDNCVFYIPILKNKSGMKNLLDSYTRIRSKSNSLIVIILNQASSIDTHLLKQEFAYFFGDKDLNIKGAYPEIYKDENLAVSQIKDTNVFDLADTYELTAYEIANDNMNVGEFLKSKREEGYEEFKKALSFVNIYNLCKDYKKEVLDLFFKECK